MKGYIILLLVLVFISCNHKSEYAETIQLYLERVTESEIDKNQVYILVSDYGCSSCKEDIYQMVEKMALSDTSVIITDPKNSNILKIRFKESFEKKIVYMDDEGLNKEFGIVSSKPLTIIFRNGKWEIFLFENKG